MTARRPRRIECDEGNGPPAPWCEMDVVVDGPISGNIDSNPDGQPGTLEPELELAGLPAVDTGDEADIGLDDRAEPDREVERVGDQ